MTMDNEQPLFKSTLPNNTGKGKNIKDLPKTKAEGLEMIQEQKEIYGKDEKSNLPKTKTKKPPAKEPKKVNGRPTKYSEELCDKIVEFFKIGMSIEEICLELDICKQTFYNWCESNKSFLDAKKKGLDFSKGWWQKQARINLKDKDFNATLFYMNMKNRFGWSDKQEVKMDAVVDSKAERKAVMDILKNKHKEN